MNYVISKTLMTQTIDDETLLMDTQTHLFYELNSVGAVLWDTLQKHQNLDDVLEEMLEAYDVSETQLRSDMEQFVLRLKEQGMIEIDNS